MEYEDLNGRDVSAAEQMIIEALILLDPSGCNVVVDESLEVVRQSFLSARKGESISGYETLQRARWQLAVLSKGENH